MRVGQRGADVAVVGVGFDGGKTRRSCRFALFGGGGGLLDESGQILAIRFGLLDERVRIELIEGRVRRVVGEIEALRQGQANGARESQLVFFERILGRDQLLLERLIVDAGTQLVEQRRRACLVIVHGLIERNLGGGYLRLNAADFGLVGEHQQIGVADSEHNQVARVLGGQLRGGKVVPRGKIVAQRIERRPATR